MENFKFTIRQRIEALNCFNNKYFLTFANMHFVKIALLFYVGTYVISKKRKNITRNEPDGEKRHLNRINELVNNKYSVMHTSTYTSTKEGIKSK